MEASNDMTNAEQEVTEALGYNFLHGTPRQAPMPGRDFFTFAIVYDFGGEECAEEIDLWARHSGDALDLALMIAAVYYTPGWVRVVELAKGGSKGLVRW